MAFTSHFGEVAKSKEYCASFSANPSIIKFSNGDWLMIMSHSFHHDCLFIGRWDKACCVGDAILAVDNNGKFYKNDGHICGSFLIFSDKNIETKNDFLKLTVNGREWKELKK